VNKLTNFFPVLVSNFLNLTVSIIIFIGGCSNLTGNAPGQPKTSVMKKLSLLLAILPLVLLSFVAQAQSKTGADFFAGKWSALIAGTPYGDLKRIYVLEKKDNGLSGTVLDSTGKEVAKCSKVEVKDNELTLYYTAMGNDVSVVLSKKDEDHVAGSAMGMFDVKGERIK
jgi:hypothetical protein